LPHSWGSYLPQQLSRGQPAIVEAVLMAARAEPLPGFEALCHHASSEHLTVLSVENSWESSTEHSAESSDRKCPVYSSECSTLEDSDSESFSLQERVLGHVWILSQNAKGSRIVQEALERAPDDAARAELGAELRGHVAKAVRCPHANHVLQKYIAVASSESIQFIVDELLERSGLVTQAARHRYGCRIIQQLLRFCPSSQLFGIVEVLLADAVTCCCHPFGNFVMQQLLEHGTEDTQHRLFRVLEQNVGVICGGAPGCNVVSAALAHGPSLDRVWLARALLENSSGLQALARTRRGAVTFPFILEVLQGGERERARLILSHCQGSDVNEQVNVSIGSEDATGSTC